MGSTTKGLAAGAAFSVVAVSLALLFLEGGAVYAGPGGAAENAPVVKITAPANNSSYKWDSLVRYHVVVSYQGKSTEYQEIPSSEVLVQTTYVADLSNKHDAATQVTDAGLLEIVRSNCIGCHEFKATAMGPSFAQIAARYPNTPPTVDALASSIREGSTRVWGPGNMPPHPELSNEQAHAMTLWIMKSASDQNVNYYAGAEGAIRMASPGTPSPNGGMIVTASYTARTASDQEQAARGEDTVILHGK